MGSASSAGGGLLCMARLAWWIGALGGLLSACAAGQQEAPPVVPYRPSVATPADLPAPGWPELEAGWTGAKGGDVARSQSLPLLFKLAWSPSWALLVGTDAYDRQKDFEGNVAHSGGDTMLALKYRFPVIDAVALGAQIGPTLATARPPIGSGRTDWGLTAIASFDSEAAHVDVNAGATLLGAVDHGQGRWEGAWAIAASHPLAERFGSTGELSGTAQHGTAAHAQGLVALSYNVSSRLVLDVAVAAGLAHASPEWQLATGLTVQLGHWFQRASWPKVRRCGSRSPWLSQLQDRHHFLCGDDSSLLVLANCEYPRFVASNEIIRLTRFRH